jgi:hypothetical protein
MGYLKVCLISVSSSLLITLCIYLYNLTKKSNDNKINYKDYIKVLLISLIVTAITSGVILETSLVENLKKSISSNSDTAIKSGGGQKVKVIKEEVHIDTSPPNF